MGKFGPSLKGGIFTRGVKRREQYRVESKVFENFGGATGSTTSVFADCGVATSNVAERGRAWIRIAGPGTRRSCRQVTRLFPFAIARIAVLSPGSLRREAPGEARGYDISVLGQIRICNMCEAIAAL